MLAAVSALPALGQSNAAYERGRMNLARGDTASALEIWARALEGGAVDHLLLADAYVQLVFEAEDDARYVSASTVYSNLLEAADRDLSQAERAVVDRCAAQITMMLDAGWHERIVVSENPTAIKLRHGAGTLLAAWWRRQDALPATAWNERLIEHLQRVTKAHALFGNSKWLRGFDDRGEIYVRLGDPTNRSKLSMHDLKSVPTHETAFVPRNEVWRYDNLGEYAEYIFVDEGGFHLATPLQLLPNSLRRPFDTGSQPNRTGLMAYGLYDAYEQLSQFNPHYLPLYVALGNVIDAQQMMSLDVKRLLSGSERFSGSSDIPGVGPQLFSEIQRINHQFRLERQNAVPSASTSVMGEDPLLVRARTARFLESDGSTRIELYWTLASTDVQPPAATTFRLLQDKRFVEDAYTFRVSAVGLEPDFSAASIIRELVRAEGPFETRELRPRTIIISEVEDGGHLALQLDQYVHLSDRKSTVRSPSGGGPDLAFVRSGTFRRDSLAALNADPAVLEMSDLVVLRRAEASDDWEPLVGDEILPTDQLALKFEVYHLLFDDDDQAHVQVDYRIERSHPRSLLGRLVRRNQDDAVVGSVRERTSTRTAQQFLELDLGMVNANEELDIAITATDLVTGASKSRMRSVAVTSRLQP